MALCVTYGVAPAWAATFVAAKRPAFRTDERQHVSTADSPAPPTAKVIFNTVLQQRANFSFIASIRSRC
ncbi:MAG: hypothetical protein DBY37_13335 [Desulfovibrionaceae bacterium]|nr:MAG: hypothetical protein DBY37_13335 [Desulfovibrionaceae bacterium]